MRIVSGVKRRSDQIFISNLKRYRHALGLTQEKFSELAHMSLRGFQKYEQGESRPTPEILDRFAKVLGIQGWMLMMPPRSGAGALKDPDFAAAADFFSRLSGLPPSLYNFVLGLVYRGSAYSDRLPPEARRQLESLLKFHP